VTYTANVAGHVILGSGSTSNIARVTLHSSNPEAPVGTQAVVERKDTVVDAATGGVADNNWKLFDIVNKTFSFGANATVKLDLTYWRLFEETPEAFRRYVTAKGKAEFLLIRNAARDLVTLSNREADEAWHECLKDHLYRGGNKAFQRRRTYRTILDNYGAANPVSHLGPYITPL
jgi:hypothetical protein